MAAEAEADLPKEINHLVGWAVVLEEAFRQLM